MIRGRGAVLAVACSGFALLSGGVAAAKPPAKPAAAAPAGPRDKAVLRLDEDALGKDYLETNFIKAEKKLQQAIAICAGRTPAPSGCRPSSTATSPSSTWPGSARSTPARRP